MMPETRNSLARFVPRLKCLTAGHKMSEWDYVRTPDGRAFIRSRYCRRECGLPGGLEAQRREVPRYG